MKRLAVVGGGAMGGALVGGLLARRALDPHTICVADPAESVRAHVEAEHRVATTDDPGEAVAGADAVLVAVKPIHAEAACRAFAPRLGDAAVVVSVAAGITTAAIESWLPEGSVVVRSMPNTPALVGRGITAIAPGSLADEAALDLAETILSAVGVVVRLPETKLDAVTAVSGSGPAYVFLVAEALLDAAQQVGLSRQVATILVENTIAGAAALLLDSERTPGELREQVTSPGGTTAAALAVFEDRGFVSAFADAVAAATARSKELGQNASTGSKRLEEG